MTAYRYLLALFLFLMGLVAYADGVPRSSHKVTIEALHRQYLTTTNASDGEQIKESLQRYLDTNPSDLLGISDLNIPDICDGTDIDMDSNLDTKKMLMRVTQRIEKIKTATVKPELKRACLAALEKFKTCIVSQGCELN